MLNKEEIMKKLIIVLSLLLFTSGCYKDIPSSKNPKFVIGGTVKEVKYIGGVGFASAITTIIYFTDGRVKTLKGAIDILYTDIEIYRQCIAGCYDIKQGNKEGEL